MDESSTQRQALGQQLGDLVMVSALIPVEKEEDYQEMDDVSEMRLLFLGHPPTVRQG